MLDKAFKGSKTYWSLVFFLLVVAGIGIAFYMYQFSKGLTVTGMSRDISWGLYIGQFTFFVGVAASAVMVVLPYYLHNVKEFGKITVLGEFLAISAVIMCMTFIFVDMGQPTRLFNMILHPTPNSIMFWDFIALGGYLLLNILISWNVLEAERFSVDPPKWVKKLIYISIPWAVSIHTVTAFLYAGLPGRHYWLTSIMAVRFLASAFAAGPALLIVLCFILKKYTKFDAGEKAIQKLSVIVTYAMVISVFLVALEFFTAFYSQIPGHMHTFIYLFTGLEGRGNLVPVMWLFAILAFVAVILLVNPETRKKETTLLIACLATFFSLMLEKGLGLVIGGFVPNPLHEVIDYAPTVPEVAITIGIWAGGFLILTLLYKIAISVKEEVGLENK